MPLRFLSKFMVLGSYGREPASVLKQGASFADSEKNNVLILKAKRLLLQ